MLPVNSEIQINVTRAAANQIILMKEHDFTLEGMLFRIKIGGKGCDGFTYDTGFSAPLVDDITLNYQVDNDCSFQILIDPFAAHYCKNAELDFLLNPKNNEDGFVFLNHNEHLYVGKFFKDQELVPQHLDKEHDGQH